MAEKTFYVYKITCLCDEWNGKFYIGSHYGYVDDNYTGSGKYIKEYFKLYGKDDTYTKEILYVTNSIDDVQKYEDLYLNEKLSLNIRKHSNYNFSNKTREKMSKSHKDKTTWNKGKTLSETHKKRMSKSHIGLTYNKGCKWVNNFIVEKFIKPELLEQFLLEGWVLGRLPKRKTV